MNRKIGVVLGSAVGAGILGMIFVWGHSSTAQVPHIVSQAREGNPATNTVESAVDAGFSLPPLESVAAPSVAAVNPPQAHTAAQRTSSARPQRVPEKRQEATTVVAPASSGQGGSLIPPEKEVERMKRQGAVAY